jgi:hypothetical protein
MASIISAGTTSGTALNMAGDTSGQLQLATNGSTTAVTIDTSQNVGIGTTSPAVRLDIIGSSGQNLRLRNGTLATEYYDIGRDGADGFLAFNGAQSSPYVGYKWSTTGTERMRIDSSGNLFLGTTTTQAPLSGKALTVAGPVNFNGLNTTGTIANAATTNLITFTSSQQGTYLFVSRQTGQANGGIVGLALVAVGSSSLTVTNLVSASVSLSASTLTVVLTNNAGGSSSFQWSYTQIM